jgi:hypothetical protein
VELEVERGQGYVQDFDLPGASLSGRVTSGPGGPAVADAQVVLQPYGDDGLLSVMLAEGFGENEQLELWPRTDALGRFELHHLGAGRYRLVVSHDEHVTEVRDPVQVADGSTAMVAVALERPANLEVRVSLPGGVPVVDGTRVHLQPDEPYERPSFGSSGNDETQHMMLFNSQPGWPAIRETKHGRAVLSSLRAGGWTVQVVALGAAPDEKPTEVLAERALTLAPGEFRVLELVVRP